MKVNVKDFFKKVLAFIKAQFLPLAFLVAVLVAMLAPAPGRAVVSVEAGPFRLVEMINIIIVFFISGLALKTDDMGRSLKQWPSLAWAVVAILAITPTLGFAFTAIPFTPPEFGAGLAIFSAAPTTLGVGAALVRQAGGNDALALLILTITNMIAVFTSPLWIKALLGNNPEYNLSFQIPQVLWQLVVTVLVPAIIGKALRDLVPAARRFATKYKEELSMFSVANLAFIVWQTLSAAQNDLVHQKFVNILYVIIAAVVQHGIYLVFNFLVMRFIFRPPAGEVVAVVFMASQKSAPVAITLISYITQSASTQGLLSAPCIVGQLVQIFMGAAFAPIVKRQIVKIKARRAASESEKALPAAESGDESNGEGKKGDRVQIIVDKGDGDVMLTTLQPKDCAGKLAVVVAHEAGMDNGESTQATAEPKAA